MMFASQPSSIAILFYSWFFPIFLIAVWKKTGNNHVCICVLFVFIIVCICVCIWLCLGGGRCGNMQEARVDAWQKEGEHREGNREGGNRGETQRGGDTGAPLMFGLDCSFHLSLYLCFHLSFICLCICLCICPCICHFDCLCICLCVGLCICHYNCLYMQVRGGVWEKEEEPLMFGLSSEIFVFTIRWQIWVIRWFRCHQCWNR